MHLYFNLKELHITKSILYQNTKLYNWAQGSVWIELIVAETEK